MQFVLLMQKIVAFRELVSVQIEIPGDCSEILGQAFAEYIFETASLVSEDRGQRTLRSNSR